MSQANFVNGTGGSVNPARFVIFDATANKAVNQAAGTSAFIVGVSQEYAKYSPIPNASTVAADAAGDPLLVYQETNECLLSTTAGWTAGQLLTSDVSGQGVAATSGDYYGAVALTTITSGYGQVKVVTGKLPS